MSAPRGPSRARRRRETRAAARFSARRGKPAGRALRRRKCSPAAPAARPAAPRRCAAPADAPTRPWRRLSHSLAAGEGQRSGRLLQHLRGQPVFQREEGAPTRAVAAGIFEAGGDEGFEAGTSQSCRIMSVRLATATTDSGASRASLTNPRDHSAMSAADGSLLCADGSDCRHVSAACAPAPRQMSAVAWAKSASSLSAKSDLRSALIRQNVSWQSGPALTNASSSEPSAQRSSRHRRRRQKSPPSNRGTRHATFRGDGSSDGGV